FHSLDDGTARVGERLTPLRDYPHHGLGIESGRADRLLDLEHRLEQLGVESHLLLRHLPLGDIELGAEIADLTAGLVPHRLPAAGAPANLSGAGYHSVLLVSERST